MLCFKDEQYALKRLRVSAVVFTVLLLAIASSFIWHIDLVKVYGTSIFHASFSREGIAFGYIVCDPSYIAGKPPEGILFLEYYKGTAMTNYQLQYETNWLAKYFVYAGEGTTSQTFSENYIVVISEWAILLSLAIFASMMIARYCVVRKRGHSDNVCFQCGYIIYDAERRVCPECGEEKGSDPIN